jgi:outer membrane protein TolC
MSSKHSFKCSRSNATLLMRISPQDKARLELGVLLFPDPLSAYTTDPPAAPPVLPTREEVNQLASKNNPEIRSALAAVNAANAGVKSAKAAYLPDLGLNFTYGIDAPQFAKHGPDGVPNLGYSISGTVDIPVWDWLSTQKRIKQSEIQRDVATVNLTATQRRLIATLEESYAERQQHETSSTCSIKAFTQQTRA